MSQPKVSIHPAMEKVAKLLFSIGGVPLKEQHRMIKRAAKYAAGLYDQLTEAKAEIEKLKEYRMESIATKERLQDEIDRLRRMLREEHTMHKNQLYRIELALGEHEHCAEDSRKDTC